MIALLTHFDVVPGDGEVLGVPHGLVLLVVALEEEVILLHVDEVTRVDLESVRDLREPVDHVGGLRDLAQARLLPFGHELFGEGLVLQVDLGLGLLGFLLRTLAFLFVAVEMFDVVGQDGWEEG